MHGYQLSFDSIPVQPAPAPVRRAVLHRERAAALKADAIARVEQHANAEWKTYALEVVKRVAQGVAEFNTDAVIAAMQDAPITTHEMRALGPIMLAAARAGFIVATDKFVTSDSVSRHRSPKRVWKSNLYPRSLEQ